VGIQPQSTGKAAVLALNYSITIAMSHTLMKTVRAIRLTKKAIKKFG
jgi:hypothetical protein